jgi:2-polyprenyl-6-methoxyphenol hydroxylase-like FAD-dependent oxidoreductase
MKPLPTAIDVVIVGAGPVGLVLACVLANMRVPFLIVDELEEG